MQPSYDPSFQAYQDPALIDAELSAKGEDEARSLRAQTDPLEWELVVVSPLLRTLQACIADPRDHTCTMSGT